MPPSQQVFGIKKILMEEIDYLGGGFKYFSCSPLFGEDEPILTSIFFRWVVQPPTSCNKISDPIFSSSLHAKN